MKKGEHGSVPRSRRRRRRRRTWLGTKVPKSRILFKEMIHTITHVRSRAT